MSFLRRKPAPSAPPPPAEWRPQAYSGHSFRDVRDPIIEPGWSGVRAIARLSRGADGSVEVTIVDEEGVDATAEFERVARAIGEAALAEELILDGYLSVEPTQKTEGLGETLTPPQSSGRVVSRMFVGGLVHEPDPTPKLDPERPIAFVAVDLLLIDGSSLVDLPLMERKRLLDGALAQGELVRVTPFTRPPLGSFASTWHALGFRHVVFKAANGRYHPDGTPGEWATAPLKH